jgi:succinate dehydrogenase / fumarate reductase membrane anchor subunit
MTEFSKSRLRSNMGRVRGLGSAKHGAHHWWLERMTSLALIPLSIWFVAALVLNLLGASREEVQMWVAQPLTALLLASLSAVAFIHAKMGVQVIIEDYVHHERNKLTLIVIKNFIIYALLAVTLAAIAKLHFIGI